MRVAGSIRISNVHGALGLAPRVCAAVVFAGCGLLGSIPESTAQATKAPEIVVHVTDLPKGSLSEFSYLKDPGSPGGRLAGTPNNGDELDPPPENDPHVTFKVPVRAGVAYKCWVHMKVGKPKGKSQANMFFLQFSNAVDAKSKEIFKPGTKSYLIVRGPQREGWTWVGRDLANPKASEPLIYFKSDGEVTVRLQAGMEGVGFDQLVLSPARFIDKAPTDAIVTK